MRRVQLPEEFLRTSRNPSVAYAFQKAFLPDGFVSTAANSQPRLILEWFFTDRHRACLKLPAEEWDRYRLVQYTIPAICAFRWAGYLDAAGGPDSHVEQLDKYFTAFLEVNLLTLFGDWPPDPVLDALMPMKWYEQLERWRGAIEAREGGILIGSFPHLLEPPPLVITQAMSPSQDAAYPALIWHRGRCRLVQSRQDEDTRRAEGWHAYGEPDVDLSQKAPHEEERTESSARSECLAEAAEEPATSAPPPRDRSTAPLSAVETNAVSQPAAPIDDRPLLTLPEAAKRLRMSVASLKRRGAEGKIVVLKLGPKTLRVSVAEVERALRSPEFQRYQFPDRDR